MRAWYDYSDFDVEEGRVLMKAVVVGASSGLGRCIGVGLAKRGADVALMARTRDRLVEAAKEAGPGTLAIPCDVTDASSCHAAIDEAAGTLGGIDAIVYTPAIGPLRRLVDLDADTWHQAFATNVVGAALFTTAALPHLEESKGTAAYLSSVSTSQTPAWPGLGAYIVTKAGLDKLVEAWRAEHPTVGFTRVVVGDCAAGTGDSMTRFADNWDPQLAMELGTEWVSRNLLAGYLMDVEELVRVVDTVLRGGASASIPSVVVTPRPPGVPLPEGLEPPV
jgi:NAD(P)-dependent dehydrogenase (short-subunit alcohol dehydrogenase family)